MVNVFVLNLIPQPKTEVIFCSSLLVKGDASEIILPLTKINYSLMVSY